LLKWAAEADGGKAAGGFAHHSKYRAFVVTSPPLASTATNLLQDEGSDAILKF
jgi:hypothetical protein